MKLDEKLLSRIEPALGGARSERLTGLEPRLSRVFGPLYGRFRFAGLEAPIVEGRRRPLVVLGESDSDTGQLVTLLADSNGYEVEVTDNGLTAIELTRTKYPNLIVVNLNLVNRSGLQIIHDLRAFKDEKVRHIPMLVMDVQRRRQDISDAFDAGADDYLVMPYDLPALLSCWQRIIQNLRRPAPISALLNEDAMVRQLAVTYLLRQNPDGVRDGLCDLLQTAEPSLRILLGWVLRRLGEPT